VSVSVDSEKLLMAGINYEKDSIKDKYNEILLSRCEECDTRIAKEMSTVAP